MDNKNKLEIQNKFDRIVIKELIRSFKDIYSFFGSFFGGFIIAFNSFYKDDLIKSAITGVALYLFLSIVIFGYRFNRRKFVEEVYNHKKENDKLKKQLEDMSSQNRYCDVSLEFNDEYGNLVSYENPETTSLNKNSDLWYIFVNTRQFDKCKELILDYIDNNNSNSSFDKYLRDVELWTLLGASEILIKFRTSVNKAQSVEKELLEVLKRPIPIVPLNTKYEFKGNPDSLLESTHKNKKGIQLINCTYERILSRTNGHDFKYGKLKYQGTLSKNLRSTKAFIKFHFEKHNQYNAHFIRDVLPSYKDTVESFAICEHSDRKELKFIIIEAHYPCGRFHDLFTLSKELETWLTNDLVKETYIAYSGGPINELKKIDNEFSTAIN